MSSNNNINNKLDDEVGKGILLIDTNTKESGGNEFVVERNKKMKKDENNTNNTNDNVILFPNSTEFDSYLFNFAKKPTDKKYLDTIPGYNIKTESDLYIDKLERKNHSNRKKEKK